MPSCTAFEHGSFEILILCREPGELVSSSLPELSKGRARCVMPEYAKYLETVMVTAYCVDLREIIISLGSSGSSSHPVLQVCISGNVKRSHWQAF